MITYPLNNVLYHAEDAELFHCTRSSGVYSGDDFSYLLTGTDNNITIQQGIGWIRNSKFSGKVVALKSNILLNLDVADSLHPRIDAVVIQFDSLNNTTQIVVKNGIASASPNAPDVVRTESLYELHLYHIRRNVGSVTITASDVTDMRLSPDHCGLMADSVTKIDTSAIQKQIEALIGETQSKTESIISDAEAETERLVSETEETLNGIVSGIDEKISNDINEKLTEAKESGEFDGPQGPVGPQGPAGSDANVTAENIQNALGYAPAPKSYILHGTIDDDNNVTLTNFNWDELVAAITSAENVYVAARLVNNGEYQTEYALKQYSYFDDCAEFSFDYAGNLYGFEVYSDGTINYYDASLNSEEWKFTLEDGTIVWKRVYVG